MAEHNIDVFINWFFGFLWDGFAFCYNYLDSFKFRGISLLDFILALIVISVALPIVLNLITGVRDTSRSYYDSMSSKTKIEKRIDNFKRNH